MLFAVSHLIDKKNSVNKDTNKYIWLFILILIHSYLKFQSEKMVLNFDTEIEILLHDQNKIV